MAMATLSWRILRAVWIVVLVLVCVFLLGGCAYTVHVRGVQFDEQTEVTPQAAALCVEPSPDLDQSAPDLQAKIERLLAEQGFRIVERNAADYFLLYHFGIESVDQRMNLEPTTGGVRAGMQTSFREGPFEHTLSLRIVNAEPFRKEGSEEIIWAGGAVLDGAPTESEKFDDMLLVAMFKHFPLDTGETLTERMSLDSPKAKRLREGQPSS
jgi:hypothetical protein